MSSIKRAGLALVALLTIGAGVSATPASAGGGGNDGSNSVGYWCDGLGFKDDSPSTPYTVPFFNGYVFTKLVIKAGHGDGENFVVNNPVMGQSYSHPSGKDISHIIICKYEIPAETTTTTTVPETTTTTTVPESTTTTTVPESTTTTTVPEETTTTTEPEATTTTERVETTTTERPETPPTRVETTTTLPRVETTTPPTLPPTTTVTPTPTTLGCIDTDGRTSISCDAPDECIPNRDRPSVGTYRRSLAPCLTGIQGPVVRPPASSFTTVAPAVPKTALPVTGSGGLGILGWGALLIGLGAAASIIARRRTA